MKALLQSGCAEEPLNFTFISETVDELCFVNILIALLTILLDALIVLFAAMIAVFVPSNLSDPPPSTQNPSCENRLKMFCSCTAVVRRSSVVVLLF